MKGREKRETAKLELFRPRRENRDDSAFFVSSFPRGIIFTIKKPLPYAAKQVSLSPVIIFLDHYSLPFLLPLNKTYMPSPFLCQLVLFGSSHVRNSCFMFPPIFLFLFSLTFLNKLLACVQMGSP